MAVINNVKQTNNIVAIPISYSDLYNLDRLKEIVETHININKSSIISKKETNTSNNNVIDISDNNIMDVYQQSWFDLKYKYLFDNEFELYIIWVDMVEEHYLDEYFYKLESDNLTEFDIKNNVDYDNLWYHYCDCGKTMESLIDWLNTPSEEDKPIQLSISDIYTLIDAKISQLPSFSVITPKYVILVAKSAKQIIELKGKVILPKNVKCRDTVYHHKKEGNLFVSIIDY